MDSPTDAMSHAWKAYNGDFPRSLERMKNKSGRYVGPDFNTPVNYCGPIVNIGRSFLFGKPLPFKVEEGVGQQAQDDLDLVWKANKKGIRLRELANNGGVCGHAFIKIIPDGQIFRGQTLPGIVVLDSQQVSVETAADNCHKVLAYNVIWQDKDAAGNAITKRQRFERTDDIDPLEPMGAPEQWQIRNQTRKTNYDASDPNQGWVDDEPPQKWQYDWAPIHGAPNMVNTCEYWGMPDLTPDIIETNVALNLVESSNQKIVYLFGFPLRYGKGAEPTSIEIGPDEMPWFPSGDAEIVVLDNHADLTAARAHAEDLRNAISEMSGVPAIAFGREIGGGDIPAATMRLKYQALLAKTNDKRETYGDLLSEVNAHILELMGYGAGIEVTNVWPEDDDLLPRNEKESAEASATWETLGASKYTLLQRAGFDPDEEALRKADEQKAEQDIANQAMEAFDRGDPNANPFGADGSQDGQQPPAGNLNHPAMQAARANAMQMAGGN
jgi:hypothetical protein